MRDKADAVGEKEAIDLLNVDFSERGAIRQRDGYVDLGTTDLAARVNSLSPYYNAAGARLLVAGLENGSLVVLDVLGQVLGSAAGMAPGRPFQFARFGDLTHEYLFAANGIDTLRRFDGSGWADGSVIATVDGVAGRAMPRAGSVCLTAQHSGSASGSNAANRLVATAYGTQTTAGPGGTQSTPSRVHFSNPGRPDLWEQDGDAGVPGTRDPRGRNYIELTPGDGEQILAAVTWRELVFVFKESKFFVLWGEGTGPEGTPTFQHREVVNSIGLASAQAVAVGRDGVYFMNRRGVYRTSGGDPVLISDVITPMWGQDPDVYFTSEPINLERLDLARALWTMERFYLAVPTGARDRCDRVLTYDTQHQWWSLYDLPAAALVSFRSGATPTVHFGYSTGPNRVGHRVLGSTLDRGQTIVSRWRSGWSDYGSPQQMTLRELKLWGSGAITVAYSTDFNRTLDTGIDTPLGIELDWPLVGAGTWNAWLSQNSGLWPGAGQISNALVRRAVRGTVFSTQFSNSPASPTWAVHRASRHLREIREPSIR